VNVLYAVVGDYLIVLLANQGAILVSCYDAGGLYLWGGIMSDHKGLIWTGRGWNVIFLTAMFKRWGTSIPNDNV